MILWLAVADAAELWFVPDPQLADEVREATVAEWPEVEHEVVVGTRPPQADGWSWDGQLLTVDAGATHREADASDAHVAVLLARTWAIRTESRTWRRWVPDLPPPPAPAPLPDLDPPVRTPLVATLATVVGVRSALGQPGLGQTLLLGIEGTLGPVTLSLDSGVGLLPETRMEAGGPFTSATTGYRSLQVDGGALGGSLGLRSPGTVFVQGRVGYQERWVVNGLVRDRRVVDRYTTAEPAFPVAFGGGVRLGLLRPALSGWWRTTLERPPSFGLDLEVAVVAPQIGG
ncbi:MAG: hypothetical protein H6738_14730 [Alphaproteobacteria bacterium]|nr:hypothetical protein [Alphaproteobacteria bacterium]MCB9698031.1 hypothetical protein [Alphaproteobacteria bacterium]